MIYADSAGTSWRRQQRGTCVGGDAAGEISGGLRHERKALVHTRPQRAIRTAESTQKKFPFVMKDSGALERCNCCMMRKSVVMFWRLGYFDCVCHVDTQQLSLSDGIAQGSACEKLLQQSVQASH
jgi:hypothetical protein